MPAGSGDTTYITADHLGSTRVVTNSVGNVIARHDYLPFGEEIPADRGGRNAVLDAGHPTYVLPDDTLQRFSGKERDAESGLDYFEARYFSGSEGRFTSPDPRNAGATIADPQNWNGYAYVRNLPMRLVDLHGLGPRCVVDGVEVECNMEAFPPESVVRCPNDSCDRYDYNQQKFETFVAGAGGSRGYVDFSHLGELNEWGGRFYDGGQFKKQILEPRIDVFHWRLAKYVAGKLGINPDFVYQHSHWVKTVNGNANFSVDPELDLSTILNETNRYRSSDMPSAHIHTKDNFYIHLDMANPWTHFPLGALIHLFGDNILGRLNGNVPMIY